MHALRKGFSRLEICFTLQCEIAGMMEMIVVLQNFIRKCSLNIGDFSSKFDCWMIRVFLFELTFLKRGSRGCFPISCLPVPHRENIRVSSLLVLRCFGEEFVFQMAIFVHIAAPWSWR